MEIKLLDLLYKAYPETTISNPWGPRQDMKLIELKRQPSGVEEGIEENPTENVTFQMWETNE